MVLRPATPGFLVTLAATICLALVSFGVPLLKTFYFLSATINYQNIQGTATFGVLGYCLQTGANQACSNATVGWEFDPNALLSLNLPLNIDIPQVVVKWITYVLVLHIVGLGLAAISAVFGLLAHVREMAMTCFSSCVAGSAAVVVLLAFIFDLVFFFLIKARVTAVGGTATIGNALWLTLAAWVMLFFSGVFFAIGRCCFSSRPRVPKGSKNSGGGGGWGGFGRSHDATGGIPHSEAMRLEAVKAEADRKARQAEVGLPAFPTNGEAVPLKPKAEAQYYVEEDSDEDNHKPHYVPVTAGAAGGPHRRNSGSTTYTTNYAGRGRQQSTHQQQYAGGYMQGVPGTRSIDVYNNGSAQNPAFPAGPSGHAPYRQASGHSGYGYNSQPSSPPPMPIAQNNAYLTPGAGVGEVYGHGTNQSSYHSAVSHHTGQPSSYSQFDQAYTGSNDPYNTHQQNQSQLPGAYPSQARDQGYGSNAPGGYSAPVAGYARRGPISPRGPRSAGQGHVAAPWSQPGPMMPQESPPGYEMPPAGAGGAAPYPPEKR
ncbi:hypothetical protein M408DRAFT_60648 [Serendipita vermifera MAFF 305830]|uniref:Pali-domain-containing protein n=1 Tax=Serendipita vermifera MAFF 305830 TaxID=933852 RepID=A0A0C2XY25_SERVB|nr:hypothetical protein M408DRAFT_60648 [Serendipita vermifera MAFF 305830]